MYGRDHQATDRRDRERIPAAPGQPARYAYQYKRQGVASLFLLLEPLTGVCHVKVTERHTKKDWALFIRDLVDKYFPEADTITLVMDNLSTHKKAALYDKLGIHFTPTHASWLNMAEIGFNILSRQCLVEFVLANLFPVAVLERFVQDFQEWF